MRVMTTVEGGCGKRGLVHKDSSFKNVYTWQSVLCRSTATPSTVSLGNPWWWLHHLQGGRHSTQPITETVLAAAKGCVRGPCL